MSKNKKSIPKRAVRIHLYHYTNVLRPRGSMNKESIGLEIYDRLSTAFKEWTNPVYGDNPEPDKLLRRLKENLHSEVTAAWEKFELSKK